VARTNLLNDPVFAIVDGFGSTGATASDVWANLPQDLREERTYRGMAHALLALTELGKLARRFEYEQTEQGGVYRRLRYWSPKNAPIVGVQSGTR